MRNIVTCGRYLCIAEGKKKDTIPVSNLWMVSFFWNGLHAIQVVLHYIKQVAGLQIFLLHQSSQSFCGIAVICNIRNSLLQLPAVFGKIAFTHDTIKTDEPRTLDFSGVRGFLVTNVCIVQRSAA